MAKVHEWYLQKSGVDFNAGAHSIRLLMLWIEGKVDNLGSTERPRHAFGDAHIKGGLGIVFGIVDHCLARLAPTLLEGAAKRKPLLPCNRRR